ncbi:hypothetical protein ES703_120864 [subsurface metagenome]
MIRGCYFYSQKCKKCGKLITGEHEESRKKAKKDFNRKINHHHNQEHSHATTRQKQKSAVQQGPRGGSQY